MHAASMSSARLKALHRVLSDGKPHSTRDIARKSGILAISASVAELRQRGARVICERKKVPVVVRGRLVDEKFVFFYTMLKAPDNA